MKQDVMENLVNKLEGYKRQLEMSEGSLVSHNFIVVVGAYTVGLDENSRTVLRNVDYPSQFTQRAVNEILQSKFSTAKGLIVKPEVYFYKDWYKQNIEAIEQILEHYKTKIS